MTASAFLISFAELWLILGALVAAVFLIFGIDKIDEDAEGALGFRPLIVPGVLLIWPLVLWRWWVLSTGRDKWQLRHRPPRSAHGAVWIGMAVILLLIMGSAFVLRQTWPADVPSVQIAPAAEVVK